MTQRRATGSRGTTGARSGSGRAAVAAGAAVLALVAVGGGAIAWRAREAPPPAPTLHDKYAKYMTSYPFGGRTVLWWSERLNELEKGGGANDKAMFELTLARAKAAGLEAAKVDGVWIVNPSEPLTKDVFSRLGVE